MRMVHVPDPGALTRARSNTLGEETLDVTRPCDGFRIERSTSLCVDDSGHHNAASSRFCPETVRPIGMSMVCPLFTLTFPHHAHPSVGRRSGPAPLVLLTGYDCCPERIICA